MILIMRFTTIALISISLSLSMMVRLMPDNSNSDLINMYIGGSGRERCKDPICSSFLRKCTFEIDGKEITLRKGFADEKVSSGSTSKCITRYAGRNVTGDFNGDGLEDAVVILTRETGGSGTFYYAAAVLSSNEGYKGTNAIFLGDRINVESLDTTKGRICINYLEHSDSDPMTAKPSSKNTRYLEIKSGRLKEARVLLITSKEWRWQRTVLKKEKIVVPRISMDFSVSFSANGMFSGKTDCNNYSGQFIQSGNNLQLGPMITTRKYCAGSQENDFLKFLGEAVSYSFSDEASLKLNLKDESGYMIFE
jgi:heat shock protein HslJ